MQPARIIRPKRPRAYEPPVQLVDQRVIWHADGPEIILPLVVHAQHGYAKAAKEIAASARAEHKCCVLAQLNGWFRSLPKDRIEHIDYTRISLSRMAEHDNLPWAFKHIVDITSYWVIDGRPLPQGAHEWLRIGRYDDILVERGKPTWSYLQRTNGEGERRQRKKPQGIAIRFHLSPGCSATR